MVVVDSTIWIDYLQGVSNDETNWLDEALGRERLGLTDIILCEVLQGVSDDDRAQEVEDLLVKVESFRWAASHSRATPPEITASCERAATPFGKPLIA